MRALRIGANLVHMMPLAEEITGVDCRNHHAGTKRDPCYHDGTCEDGNSIMATILVVDDESPIVALLEDILEENGHIVFTAHNGRAAFDTARQEHPDLVISDVMMPVLDGIGLSRMLREEPATAGMLVILMSAARPPDLAAAGAVAFMGKPFMVEQVNALIARHLAHDT